MPKSSGGPLFGRASRRGTVTVIEAPVSFNFRRRARVTYFVVAGVAGLLAATVASHYLHPIIGLLLGLLIGAVVAAPPALVVLTWPVLRVFLRWWIEIAMSLLAVYGWTWLNSVTNLLISLLAVAAICGVPAAVGPARRTVWSAVMCLLVRHRLRMCFASFIIANRQGTVPLVLVARPTPAGERAWVWLRPGLALSDLEGRTDRLAVACWANEVRVVRASSTYAALIRVDVTRRNPVAGRVPSTLPGLVPDFDASAAPTSPGMPPVALDLRDVPDTTPPPRPARPGRTHPRTTGEPGADNPHHFGSDNADWA